MKVTSRNVCKTVPGARRAAIRSSGRSSLENDGLSVCACVPRRIRFRLDQGCLRLHSARAAVLKRSQGGDSGLPKATSPSSSSLSNSNPCLVCPSTSYPPSLPPHFLFGGTISQQLASCLFSATHRPSRQGEGRPGQIMYPSLEEGRSSYFLIFYGAPRARRGGRGRAPGRANIRP